MEHFLPYRHSSLEPEFRQIPEEDFEARATFLFDFERNYTMAFYTPL